MDYKVQSVLFKRPEWSEAEAKKWVKENKFKNLGVDVKPNHYRYRQLSPNVIRKQGYKHFVTKHISESIDLIIAYKEKPLEGGSISASELQKFISASYSKNPEEKIDNWVLDKQLSTPTAAVYSDPTTGKATITHRGTSGAADWMNNLKYSMGMYNSTDRYKQGKAAQEAAEAKYGQQNLSTLGHSQGAVLARKLGQDSKEIVNLNPAYLGETQGKNEYNVRSGNDVVSAFQKPKQMFNSWFYPSQARKDAAKNIEIKPAGYNPLAEHSSDILGALDPNLQIGAGHLQRLAEIYGKLYKA